MRRVSRQLPVDPDDPTIQGRAQTSHSGPKCDLAGRAALVEKRTLSWTRTSQTGQRTSLVTGRESAAIALWRNSPLELQSRQPPLGPSWTGVRERACFGELRRRPPAAGLDWITGIGDTTSTELYRTRLKRFSRSAKVGSAHAVKSCFSAVNAEVAKRDILATRNPLKCRGRPTLIVLISKLHGTS